MDDHLHAQGREGAITCESRLALPSVKIVNSHERINKLLFKVK